MNEKFGKSAGGYQRRSEMMRDVQKYNFMMIEAGLFLDNQPDCREAMEAFCEYQRLYLQAVSEYESCCGPLTLAGIDVKNDGWSWINSPWPWELEEC